MGDPQPAAQTGCPEAFHRCFTTKAVEPLEAELDRARALDVAALADAIEEIGFECTRCGACCKGESCGDGDSTEPHTATVQPDEVRQLQQAAGDEYDWRDVARPVPWGLTDGPAGQTGETFEWALQTDACGDCTFYEESADGTGACTVHDDRPLICATYPFSVALGGTDQPMGETVDEAGMVRAHECEGLGREIDRAEAVELAEALRERAIRDIESAIAVRDQYEPVETDADVVVHDAEGPKRTDGTPLEE
jgi:Fe-S-cluster containining protein